MTRAKRQPTKPVCTECKSDDVAVDSFSDWNVETQRFEHANDFDSWFCRECDGECSVDWVKV
jgi:hypothetical protein